MPEVIETTYQGAPSAPTQAAEMPAFDYDADLVSAIAGNERADAQINAGEHPGAEEYDDAEALPDDPAGEAQFDAAPPIDQSLKDRAPQARQEPTEALTPRANDRIRQLNEQRRAAESREQEYRAASDARMTVDEYRSVQAQAKTQGFADVASFSDAQQAARLLQQNVAQANSEYQEALTQANAQFNFAPPAYHLQMLDRARQTSIQMNELVFNQRVNELKTQSMQREAAQRESEVVLTDASSIFGELHPDIASALKQMPPHLAKQVVNGLKAQMPGVLGNERTRYAASKDATAKRPTPVRGTQGMPVQPVNPNGNAQQGGGKWYDNANRTSFSQMVRSMRGGQR